jgi:hypothetical protein
VCNEESFADRFSILEFCTVGRSSMLDSYRLELLFVCFKIDFSWSSA